MLLPQSFRCSEVDDAAPRRIRPTVGIIDVMQAILYLALLPVYAL